MASGMHGSLSRLFPIVQVVQTKKFSVLEAAEGPGGSSARAIPTMKPVSNINSCKSEAAEAVVVDATGIGSSNSNNNSSIIKTTTTRTAVESRKSARETLDFCIKGLEDHLGVPPKAIDEAAVPTLSMLQLVNNAIAELEASLGLKPERMMSKPNDTVAIRVGGTLKGSKTAVASGSKASLNPAGPRHAEGGGNKSQGEGKRGGGAPRNTGMTTKGKAVAGASAIDQPEGSKVDLRVGRINSVWVHEAADKLYCEEIDVGEETPRKIASCLVPHYSLDEMKGRRVVVMCNLKPRNLKGFKSQGMVVCAVAALGDGKEKVELLLPPEEASVGDKLFFDGLTGGPFEPVSAAQIEKKKVLDKVLPELSTGSEGLVKWLGHPLVAHCGPCTAPTVRNGSVR